MNQKSVANSLALILLWFGTSLRKIPERLHPLRSTITFVILLTLIGTTIPSVAPAMRPVIKTVALCQKLLYPKRGQEFIKWLQQAQALSRRGGAEPEKFLQLLRYSSALTSDEREQVLKLISRNYVWARTHALALKRRYDLMLKFVLPESLYFIDLAHQNGATEAYHRYLEHTAELHKGHSVGHVGEAELQQMVRTIQDSLRLFKGRTIGINKEQPFVILGGSLVNGHGFEKSDLDAAPYPIHLPSEPEWADHLKTEEGAALKILLDRMDYKVYDGGFRTEIANVWKQQSALNLRQPFALIVKADEVILLHFIPTTLLGTGENPKVKFQQYKLNW